MNHNKTNKLKTKWFVLFLVIFFLCVLVWVYFSMDNLDSCYDYCIDWMRKSIHVHSDVWKLKCFSQCDRKFR